MLKRCKRVLIIGNMIKKSKNRISRTDYHQMAEIKALVDYGMDISMLIDNIHRSFSERILRHQIALNTAEKLKGARRL